MNDLDLTNPSHSQNMEYLEDAELQKIKMEGAKLSLQIERCLQQQIIAQTHARTPVLADRSRVKYTSSIFERDVERRQHPEEIHLLAEKLRDKEAECKSLKHRIPHLGCKRTWPTLRSASKDSGKRSLVRTKKFFHSRKTGRTWMCSILRRTKRKLRSRHHQSHRRTSLNLAQFYEAFHIGVRRRYFFLTVCDRPGGVRLLQPRPLSGNLPIQFVIRQLKGPFNSASIRAIFSF
jgi:hypothetical protein